MCQNISSATLEKWLGRAKVAEAHLELNYLFILSTIENL